MANIELTSASAVTLGNLSYSESMTISGNLGPNGAWALPTDQTPGTPLPQAGVLTGRASATAGTATMDDHAPSIATATLVDVYWTDVLGYARVIYGCTVGTVTPATSSTLQAIAFAGGTNSGAGADLPPLGTKVILAPSTAFEYLLDGSTLLAMTATCPVNALIKFVGDGADFAIFLPFPGMLYRWARGTTNLLDGVDVMQVYVSQCSLAALAANEPQSVQMVSLGTLVGSGNSAPGPCEATLTTSGFTDLDCAGCSAVNGEFSLTLYPAGTFSWQLIPAWLSSPIVLMGAGSPTGPCGVYVWVLDAYTVSLLDVSTGNGPVWNWSGSGPGFTGTYDLLQPTSFSSCNLPSTVTVDCDCCS